MTKFKIANIAIPYETNKTASPTCRMMRLRIMGFLTWLYKLTTMSFLVGSQGMIVPLPIRINILMVATNRTKPRTLITKPTIKKLVEGVIAD
jgi:hypothetical protein